MGKALSLTDPSQHLSLRKSLPWETGKHQSLFLVDLQNKIKGTQKAATWIALNVQLHAAEERELEKRSTNREKKDLKEHVAVVARKQKGKNPQCPAGCPILHVKPMHLYIKETERQAHGCLLG